MIDREKVMDALRRCPVNKCDGCPYKETYDKYGYGCLNEVDMDALELLEEQDQPTVAKDIKVPIKWISVKDRLPENEESVLVWEKQGFVYVDTRKGDTWVIGTPNGAIITHWMPLPESPKEDKDGE